MKKKRCPQCKRAWLVLIEQTDFTFRWGCLRCGYRGEKEGAIKGGTMIGNRNNDDFKLACCWCGTKNHLMQVAHRDCNDSVIGYLFLCDECLPIVGGNYTVSLVQVQAGKD